MARAGGFRELFVLGEEQEEVQLQVPLCFEVGSALFPLVHVTFFENI